MLEAGLGTRIRQKGGDGEIAGLPVGMNPKNRAYSAVFASSKGRGQLRLHIWWVAQRRNLERAVEKADACLTSVGKPPSNFFSFLLFPEGRPMAGFPEAFFRLACFSKRRGVSGRERRMGGGLPFPQISRHRPWGAATFPVPCLLHGSGP